MSNTIDPVSIAFTIVEVEDQNGNKKDVLRAYRPHKRTGNWEEKRHLDSDLRNELEMYGLKDYNVYNKTICSGEIATQMWGSPGGIIVVNYPITGGGNHKPFSMDTIPKLLHEAFPEKKIVERYTHEKPFNS